jgi:hypothetical protein
VAGCCECGDEPSGSCATELVGYSLFIHAVTLEFTLECVTKIIFMTELVRAGILQRLQFFEGVNRFEMSQVG